MSFVTKSVFLLAAAAAITILPTDARADEPKVRVTFGGGITAGAIDSQPTLNLSAGYRFSKRFSFDVEVAGADASADRFSMPRLNVGGVPTSTTVQIGGLTNTGRGGTMFPNINVGLPGQGQGQGQGNYRVNNSGSTLLTTVGFRYNLPSIEERFRPYVNGGMGISITDEEFSVGILQTDNRNRAMGTPNMINESTTHTGMALNGGVGASVRVFKQLSLGVDARYYRLDRGRNLGTFGGSISYGF